jgi:hypothetical protein
MRICSKSEYADRVRFVHAPRRRWKAADGEYVVAACRSATFIGIRLTASHLASSMPAKPTAAGTQVATRHGKGSNDEKRDHMTTTRTPGTSDVETPEKVYLRTFLRNAVACP